MDLFRVLVALLIGGAFFLLGFIGLSAVGTIVFDPATWFSSPLITLIALSMIPTIGVVSRIKRNPLGGITGYTEHGLSLRSEYHTTLQNCTIEEVKEILREIGFSILLNNQQLFVGYEDDMSIDFYMARKEKQSIGKNLNREFINKLQIKADMHENEDRAVELKLRCEAENPFFLTSYNDNRQMMKVFIDGIEKRKMKQIEE